MPTRPLVLSACQNLACAPRVGKYLVQYTFKEMPLLKNNEVHPLSHIHLILLDVYLVQFLLHR